MTEGLVSVIMPTYNSGRFLAESIESILNQTYRHIELLIADDCSTDRTTIDILHAYVQKDSRVKVDFMPRNLGAGEARNNAIRRADGQYIAFCDSDDRWAPEKLEVEIAAMRRGGYALCCSSYYITDDYNRIIGVNLSPRHISFAMMKRDNKVGCLTAIYDVRALGRKYYMPVIRKRQDWALFIEITRQCRVAYGVGEPLAYYRKHTNSVSSNKMSLVKYNLAIYRQCLQFSPLKSWSYFLLFFLPTYFSKRFKQKVDFMRMRTAIESKDPAL